MTTYDPYDMGHIASLISFDTELMICSRYELSFSEGAVFTMSKLMVTMTPVRRRKLRFGDKVYYFIDHIKPRLNYRIHDTAYYS